MQIILKQEDLEKAVRNYIREMGLSRPVGTIEFSTTRSPTTTQAEITLEAPDAIVDKPAPVGDELPRAKPAPEKSKAKFAPEPEPVKAEPVPEVEPKVEAEAPTTVEEAENEVEPAKTTNKKLFG